LAATTPAAPGAQRVGARAVDGTPFVLATGTVDQQLAGLLGHLNQHITQVAAHAAVDVAAQPHGYIGATNVQAQLQEIVSDLSSHAPGTSGASRIGAEAHAGAPATLPAATLRDQLGQLLVLHNQHLSAPASAHPAAAIGVADAAALLDAQNVEDGLAEVLGAFQGGHFRANQASGGQHRTIHQPALGTGRVLLWDARGTGAAAARYRVYADDTGIWHVFGASWNGSAWVRDQASMAASAWRIGRHEIELHFDVEGSAPFTTWERTWRLPLTADSTSSSLVLVGSGMQESGRVTLHGFNHTTASRSIVMYDAVTFRQRFASVPASISFSTLAQSSNWLGTPTAEHITVDGFVARHSLSLGSLTGAEWHGRYVATA
jgi:hypothetical protein